ncbi:MAG: beta-ketoacyl synthase chain length factor [Aureispira sp.]
MQQEAIYINAYSTISAQDSFYGYWEEIVPATNAFLDAQEPRYKEFLPRKQLRRMSRIVRMGLATAIQALEQGGQPRIDAIVSGTAWGCVQDTQKFLEALIVNQEQYLTPTAFVQSTHNTVAGQIALLQGNNGYNMTYVQGKVSFELALIDALTLLEQSPAQTILVNGLDELTSHLKIMLERLRCAQPTQPMGEGASCFILSKKVAKKSLARLVGSSSAYLPKEQTSTTTWDMLLKQANCAPSAIDLLLCGQALSQEASSIFKQAKHCSYVPLCGNYPTNSAFAMSIGVALLQGNTRIQQALGLDSSIPKQLAIYNQEGPHQGLIVLEQIAK